MKVFLPVLNLTRLACECPIQIGFEKVEKKLFYIYHSVEIEVDKLACDVLKAV